jgi:rhodanese-related sulfurtransferase
MDTKWIASVALALSLSCACGPSGEPERSGQGFSIRPQDASIQIRETSVSQLREWMATGQTFTLIDVREDNEWQAGHAAAAMHVSRRLLPGGIATIAPDKNARIVLYCLGGVRSAAAAAILQRMGYLNVFSLAGGFKSYRLAGLPVER